MPMCDEKVAREKLWEEIRRVISYDSELRFEDMPSELACMVSFYCGLKSGERYHSSKPKANQNE